MFPASFLHALRTLAFSMRSGWIEYHTCQPASQSDSSNLRQTEVMEILCEIGQAPEVSKCFRAAFETIVEVEERGSDKVGTDGSCR